MVINNAFAQNIRQTSFDNRPYCEQSGGIWRKYGNSCSNDCQANLDKYPNCLDKIVYSCDCGPNSCWNGAKCLTIREYKITFNQLEKKRLQELDDQKNKKIELKKSHENKDPSFFSVLTDKVKKPINSITNNNSNQEEVLPLVQIPIPAAITNNIAPTKPTTTNTATQNDDSQFEVPPVFKQMMDQKAAKQIDQAIANSIANTISNNKNR